MRPRKRDPDPLAETWEELISAQGALSADIEAFAAEVAARAANWNEGGNGEARDNAALHAAREGLRGMAERCRDLTQQIDLAAKLAGRVVDIAVKELDARESDLWANADINKARKALEDARAGAVEALKRARYFVRQADWLQERFPEAELRDVEGLVKLVDRSEIEAHDWSLTPGRYVGVAPEEEDEDFDFEEALRSIHIDLKGLNDQGCGTGGADRPEFQGVGGVSLAELNLWKHCLANPSWLRALQDREKHSQSMIRRTFSITSKELRDEFHEPRLILDSASRFRARKLATGNRYATARSVNPAISSCDDWYQVGYGRKCGQHKAA